MEVMKVFFYMGILIISLVFLSNDMQICTYSKHVQNFVCFYQGIHARILLYWNVLLLTQPY